MQRMQAKNANKRGGRRSRGILGGRGNLRPPPISPNTPVRRRFRFEASSALAGVTITGRDLFDLVCMATTTTTASQLYESVRIQAVEIWGPMASDLKPVTVDITWPDNTSIGSPQVVHSDTSMGSSFGAHVRSSPPSWGASSLWQLREATATQFILNGPVNSVVDVTLDLVLQQQSALAATVSHAVSGASVGVIYVRALDSVQSGLLVPLSYPTI